jgi:hypothetical protein
MLGCYAFGCDLRKLPRINDADGEGFERPFYKGLLPNESPCQIGRRKMSLNIGGRYAMPVPVFIASGYNISRSRLRHSAYLPEPPERQRIEAELKAALILICKAESAVSLSRIAKISLRKIRNGITITA